jgi:hypothetical protein
VSAVKLFKAETILADFETEAVIILDFFNIITGKRKKVQDCCE